MLRYACLLFTPFFFFQSPACFCLLQINTGVYAYHQAGSSTCMALVFHPEIFVIFFFLSVACYKCLNHAHTLCLPVCNCNIIWACSWCHGSWCPGGSPPGPGSVISKVMDSLWFYLAAKETPIHNVPDIVNRIQSMASMPLSSRNCLHTLATWGWALSCTRRNPGPTAPA